MAAAIVLVSCKSAPEANPNPPDPRACATDADCAWRRSGCFEVCVSKSAPVSPPDYCAEACTPVDASCTCKEGMCTDLGQPKGGQPRCGS